MRKKQIHRHALAALGAMVCLFLGLGSVSTAQVNTKCRTLWGNADTLDRAAIAARQKSNWLQAAAAYERAAAAWEAAGKACGGQSVYVARANVKSAVTNARAALCNYHWGRGKAFNLKAQAASKQKNWAVAAGLFGKAATAYSRAGQICDKQNAGRAWQNASISRANEAVAIRNQGK